MVERGWRGQVRYRLGMAVFLQGAVLKGHVLCPSVCVVLVDKWHKHDHPPLPNHDKDPTPHVKEQVAQRVQRGLFASVLVEGQLRAQRDARHNLISKPAAATQCQGRVEPQHWLVGITAGSDVHTLELDNAADAGRTG